MSQMSQDDDSDSMWKKCIKEAEEGSVPMDIMTAASLGDVEKVDELLQRNLEYAVKRNSSNWSPLMYAVWYGRSQLTIKLLQASCPPGIDSWQLNLGKDPRTGRSLLMVAARFGHLPIARLLCNKATLEEKDHGGRTPLFHAVQGASQQVVSFFLSQGADINTKDSQGESVLSLAQRTGFPGMESLFHSKCTDSLLTETAINTRKNLGTVLRELSLEKYLHLFESRNVDLDKFLSLSEEDLRKIGINLLGPRRKMAMEIQRLRELSSKPPQ